MNLNIVYVICVVAITIGILAVLAYVVMILNQIRNMLKPVDKMITEFSNEFQPLMEDMSGITSSMSNFFGRFDRITGLFLGKADLIAQGSERVTSFISAVIKDPKVELGSIAAGVKKAFEVLFNKRKGDNGNGQA